MRDLGRSAARKKWIEGLSWPEVYECFPDASPAKVRSAARRHKQAHLDDFVTVQDLGLHGREDSDNEQHVWYLGGRITTLEQLLDATKTDRDVWQVQDHDLNKWEVGAKVVRRDLTYKDGKATGTIEGGGLQVEQLIQIKARLVRKEPLPLHPVLSPVHAEVVYEPPVFEPVEGWARTLVWADPHFGFRKHLETGKLDPFHCRKTLDVIRQLTAYLQPQRMDVLGDILDLAEWSSKFLKSPEFYWTTQPSVIEAHWWLSQMRQASPGTVIKVHGGNHDERLGDAVKRHLPAAYGLRPADRLEAPELLSCRTLLDIEGLGVEWIAGYPDDEDWLNRDLRLVHGDTARKGTTDTVKAMLQDQYVNQAGGHNHRVEMGARNVRRRNESYPIFGFTVGCACRLEPGVVPGHTAKQHWQNGALIIDYEVDGSRFAVTPVLIVDGETVVDGKHFVGRARKPDVGDWNW